MGKHVAVLKDSVSADAATMIAGVLSEAGYELTQIFVATDLPQVLGDLRPDVALNTCGNANSFGWKIQGLLDWMQIPYVNSGVVASALADDRLRSKAVLRSATLPMAPSAATNYSDLVAKHPMKPPYVLKPVSGSVGGCVKVGAEQAPVPMELLLRNWAEIDPLYAERFVPGRSLTCIVMGDVALGVAESTNETLSEKNSSMKSTIVGSQEVISLEIKPNIYQKIQTIALKAHMGLGCRGVSRSNFRLDDGLMGTNELVWLGLDAHPDIGPNSMVAQQAGYAGHDYEELISWMVEDAGCNR